MENALGMIWCDWLQTHRNVLPRCEVSTEDLLLQKFQGFFLTRCPQWLVSERGTIPNYRGMVRIHDHGRFFYVFLSLIYLRVVLDLGGLVFSDLDILYGWSFYCSQVTS